MIDYSLFLSKPISQDESPLDNLRGGECLGACLDYWGAWQMVLEIDILGVGGRGKRNRGGKAERKGGSLTRTSWEKEEKVVAQKSGNNRNGREQDVTPGMKVRVSALTYFPLLSHF